MKYEVRQSSLLLCDKEIKFEFPIEKVILFKSLYIVLLDAPSTDTGINNIYALNNAGEIVWQIQDAAEVYPIINDVPYVGVRVEGDSIIIINFIGVTYTVDPLTGKIIDRGITK